MRTNLVVAENLANASHVTSQVIIPKIHKNLPQLCAPKQLLFVRFKEGEKLGVAGGHAPSKTIIEETLVAESVASLIEGQNPFRNHCAKEHFGKSVKPSLRDRQFLPSTHFICQSLDQGHPLLRSE